MVVTREIQSRQKNSKMYYKSGNNSVIFSLFILYCITATVDGTIRVISLSENETVYSVQERALILRSPNGLEGILVQSQPKNACTEVLSPPDVLNGTVVNWVLLATWEGLSDSCSLLHKIKNAEKAGYSAIVIQTTPGNDSDFIPVSDWYGISIFPCLVTYDDGKILRANFTSDDYILRFEDEPINTWLGFFIASVLVILAILLAIGLSYVIVQMLVLILLWARESIVNTIQQRRRNRRRRLPASQLKKLPIVQWTLDIPQDTCTICLETFTVEDRVRILPCSHVFHTVCIDPWLLKQRRKCPNCKGKIVFPDERCESDSSTEDERTPLIRRSSVDRDATQIFTFSDQDISRHDSQAYTAIHRIFDEAASLPRPLDQHQGPSRPPNTPVPVHQSISQGSSGKLTHHQHSINEETNTWGTQTGDFDDEQSSNEPSSTASRLMEKAKRFGSFAVPKFGKKSTSNQADQQSPSTSTESVASSNYTNTAVNPQPGSSDQQMNPHYEEVQVTIDTAVQVEAEMSEHNEDTFTTNLTNGDKHQIDRTNQQSDSDGPNEI